MGRFGDRLAKSKRPGSGLPPMRYRTSSVIRRVSTPGLISAKRLESRRTRPGYSRGTGVRASSPWNSSRTFRGSAIRPRQGGNPAGISAARPRQIVPVGFFEPAGQNVPRVWGQVVDVVVKQLNTLKLRPSNLSGMPSATYWVKFWNRVLVGRFKIVGAYGAARWQGH